MIASGGFFFGRGEVAGKKSACGATNKQTNKQTCVQQFSWCAAAAIFPSSCPSQEAATALWTWCGVGVCCGKVTAREVQCVWGGGNTRPDIPLYKIRQNTYFIQNNLFNKS